MRGRQCRNKSVDLFEDWLVEAGMFANDFSEDELG